MEMWKFRLKCHNLHMARQDRQTGRPQIRPLKGYRPSKYLLLLLPRDLSFHALESQANTFKIEQTLEPKLSPPLLHKIVTTRW